MNNILSKIKLVMAVRLSFRKLRITLSSAALVRSRMDRPELEIRHITDFLWPEVKQRLTGNINGKYYKPPRVV